MHPDTMCLHDSRRAVDVDDKSGQVVSLAMNEAIYVVASVIFHLVCYADGLSHIECCSQTFLPEGLVDALALEGQHAHSDASYQPMADGKEASVAGKHFHEVAFFERCIAFGMMDGTTEYPRMETHEAFFLTSAKDYLF